jgi:hypothetical protein
MRVGNFVLGLTIGLCLGAAGGFLATPAPKVSVASAPAVRPLAQHALVLTAKPRKVARHEFDTPLQVAQVQVLEGKTPSVLLINSTGKIVYSSGPLRPAARFANASASGSASASPSQPAPVPVAPAFVR